MHIVVLGGRGDMGSYAVRGLSAHTGYHVTIADYRGAKAQAMSLRSA